MPTGVDNSVVIKDSDNNLKTDEINNKVWQGRLVSASAAGTNNYITKYSADYSITGSSKFQYNDIDDEVTLSGIMNASQLRVSTQGTTSTSGSYGQGSRIFYGQPTTTVTAGYVYYFQSAAWLIVTGKHS